MTGMILPGAAGHPMTIRSGPGGRRMSSAYRAAPVAAHTPSPGPRPSLGLDAKRPGFGTSDPGGPARAAIRARSR